MKKFSLLYLSLSIVCVCLFISSCVKKEFDSPVTANVDPSLTVSLTISELQALTTGTVPVAITGDEVIAGIVTADDLTGNFYKEMIIQDSTGAISVQLDQSNYNTFFPIGRRVFIKCAGLFIADDGDGNYQLGIESAGTIGRIPSGLVPRYIVGGKWGLSVEPVDVTLSSISSVPTQMLVRISDVEFASPDAGQPYANPSTQQSMNREIEDCFGNWVDLYTSGYATFAGELTPTGKGTITSIYKKYSGDPELIIRNSTDVLMNDVRCGGGGGTGDTVGTGTLMSIADVRAAFTGGSAVFVSGTKIRGVVISDKSTANITANNLVLQDGSAGIVVRFTAPNTFNLNDSLEIDLTGDSLQTFQQALQVNYVSSSAVTVLGTGSVVPNVVTSNYVSTNLGPLESTLVTITGATLSGSGTYSGSVDITDATGTLIMYTRPGATFSGVAYPTGTVSVTGFISNFNGTPELILRSTADVQ